MKRKCKSCMHTMPHMSFTLNSYIRQYMATTSTYSTNIIPYLLYFSRWCSPFSWVWHSSPVHLSHAGCPNTSQARTTSSQTGNLPFVLYIDSDLKACNEKGIQVFHEHYIFAVQVQYCTSSNFSSV